MDDGERPARQRGRRRSAARAQEWLGRQLIALWDSGAPPQRNAASERALRRMVALVVQPVEPYVGLSLEQARERARGEGRTVVVAPAPDTWDPARVTVELDEDGVVTSAAIDVPPWA